MVSKKVLNNTKWIVACKAAQSILQMVIGMLSARYLGPSDYGLINYAKSIVAFAVPFMQLGLNATLVKELIDKPEQEGQVMGTALVMGMVSSLGCIASVFGFVSIANAGEPVTIGVCLLYSLSMFFQAIELIQYWFHSKLQSKYPSVMMLITYVVVSVYKIYLLIAQKNVYWFAVVYSIEYGMIGLSLLAIYQKQGVQKLQINRALIKPLISKSYPYIWAAMMVTIFQNTDHIMLKLMRGNTENGYYTAAITCVSVCQFVFTGIIDSMRPVIVANKKNASIEYENNVSKLYCLITYLAVGQGVVFSILAKMIVYVLYGTEFMEAVHVLRILAWQVPFSFMGKIRNVWILAEEKQKCLWKINCTGALLNAGINYLLIPVWGAAGAAAASLLTQVFTNFLLGFVYQPIKQNNTLLLKGLSPRCLYHMLKAKALPEE
ncbi:MAG: flippase [Clostridia bacterium]|nr:flippase [Clostridia bacterium]